MSQEIAAIFDIDGTIFRDSLLLHHMEKCIAYDVFPISVEMELKPHKNAWQNRELDYDDYLYTASKLYTKYISNKEILDVEFVAKKVIEKESKKLYRFTRDRIKWHKKQGHKIIFISGSPDFLVEKMAEKLKHFMIKQQIKYLSMKMWKMAKQEPWLQENGKSLKI